MNYTQIQLNLFSIHVHTIKNPTALMFRHVSALQDFVKSLNIDENLERIISDFIAKQKKKLSVLASKKLIYSEQSKNIRKKLEEKRICRKKITTKSEINKKEEIKVMSGVAAIGNAKESMALRKCKMEEKIDKGTEDIRNIKEINKNSKAFQTTAKMAKNVTDNSKESKMKTLDKIGINEGNTHLELQALKKSAKSDKTEQSMHNIKDKPQKATTANQKPCSDLASHVDLVQNKAPIKQSRLSPHKPVQNAPLTAQVIIEPSRKRGRPPINKIIAPPLTSTINPVKKRGRPSKVDKKVTPPTVLDPTLGQKEPKTRTAQALKSSHQKDKKDQLKRVRYQETQVAKDTIPYAVSDPRNKLIKDTTINNNTNRNAITQGSHKEGILKGKQNTLDRIDIQTDTIANSNNKKPKQTAKTQTKNAAKIQSQTQSDVFNDEKYFMSLASIQIVNAGNKVDQSKNLSAKKPDKISDGNEQHNSKWFTDEESNNFDLSISIEKNMKKRGSAIIAEKAFRLSVKIDKGLRVTDATKINARTVKRKRRNINMPLKKRKTQQVTKDKNLTKTLAQPKQEPLQSASKKQSTSKFNDNRSKNEPDKVEEKEKLLSVSCLSKSEAKDKNEQTIKELVKNNSVEKQDLINANTFEELQNESMQNETNKSNNFNFNDSFSKKFDKNSIDVELNRIKLENIKLKQLLEQAKNNAKKTERNEFTVQTLNNDVKNSTEKMFEDIAKEESTNSCKNEVSVDVLKSSEKVRSFEDIKKEIEKIFPSNSESSSKNQIILEDVKNTYKNLNVEPFNVFLENTTFSDNKENRSNQRLSKTQRKSQTRKKSSLPKNISIENVKVDASKKLENTEISRIENPFTNNNFCSAKQNIKDEFFKLKENNEKQETKKIIKPNEKLNPKADFFNNRKDLLKKVLDNDIKKTPMKKNKNILDPNDYESRITLPFIDANDKAESWFKPPEWINDPNTVNIVKKQINSVIEEYFGFKEDVDIVKMFPDQKNTTNDSPNRWPMQR